MSAHRSHSGGSDLAASERSARFKSRPETRAFLQLRSLRKNRDARREGATISRVEVWQAWLFESESSAEGRRLGLGVQSFQRKFGCSQRLRMTLQRLNADGRYCCTRRRLATTSPINSPPTHKFRCGVQADGSRVPGCAWWIMWCCCGFDRHRLYPGPLCAAVEST